jgi:hypothetical protein
LIDHDDELGLLIGENPAVAASGVCHSPDRPGKQKAGSIGRGAQMIGELLHVLPGTNQFGQSQALVGGPAQQSLNKAMQEIFAIVAGAEYEPA